MEQRRIGRLTLFYAPSEKEAAAVIEDACRRSVHVIGETWGLEPPSKCRVYVMTSLLQFILDSSPWGWRLLLAATVPLWFLRAKRLWPYVGGWMQRYGRRAAVGVKPPRLLEAADRSIGELIYIREDDVAERVGQITCHELTHAFTARLRLPSWLNEGLAQVTVDRFAGRATVRQDTLEVLGLQPAASRPSQAVRINPADRAAIVHHYVRGYWIARLLAETDPPSTRELLLARRSRGELERRIAAILGISSSALWSQVDRIVLSHFSQVAVQTPA